MNTRKAIHHFSRLAAAAATLWALCGAAAAQTFTYTGSGAVTPTGAPDSSGNLPLTVINTAYSFTGLSGLWTLVSNFSFNLGTQTGNGSFSFSQGASSLSGTLTTAAGPIAVGPGFEITYNVTSGSGIFTGAFGGGDGLIRLLDNPNLPPTPFIEAGILFVVPEPSQLALWAMGLLAVGALARRRRG